MNAETIHSGHMLNHSRNNRNYGIDLLRMVSIVMIIILHVMYQGGVLSSIPPFSAGYAATWLLEFASFGSVNIFAIISGYVNYGRRTKYSNLIQLCVQMLFYTLLTTVFFLLFFPQRVTKQTVVYSVIPFKIGGYWYFAAYFCLFFFMPFINTLVERLDKKGAVKMLAACFILFSILPTVLYHDIGGMGDGYSFAWIAVMYTVGACIKKFEFRFRPNRSFLCYFLCVAASLAGKLGMEALTLALMGKARYGNLFSSYISPFIVLSSVFLFLGFRELHLNGVIVRIVAFFAPMTFGVYLIHMEPLIKECFIVGKFANYASMPALLAVGCVILTALAIWLICSLIDRGRLYLFQLLKIPSLCERIEEKIRNAVAKSLRMAEKK